MCQTNFKLQLVLLALMMLLQFAKVSTYKRNYEAKYTKANVPLWKQRACEKVQKYKANSHYICDELGDVKCLPGWQGDLCQVPMCRKGCDPMNGYCQRPGECRCRIGYTGELCEKCIPLPGCQHGDCTKPFECICRPGWGGLFCMEPTCRHGCHNTRGYCEAPGECRCRIGWAGRNCSDCSPLPGCQHGTCSKPLECQCLAGYTGLLCQTPICNTDCHKQHGYCRKPGECRCKVGWTGTNCDKCFPYPGCANGTCEKPWECNCKPGWGGILCDEKLTYCEEHPNICENEGKCVSLTKEDGSYRCNCKQGYLGKNCEIIDEFLLTSTAAPRITPPPPINWSVEEAQNNNAALNKLNELQSSFNNKEQEKDMVKLNLNNTGEKINGLNVSNIANTLQIENKTLSLNVSGTFGNVKKFNSTKLMPTTAGLKQDNAQKDIKDENNTNKILGNMSLSNLSEHASVDIRGNSSGDIGILKANETNKAKLGTGIEIATLNSTVSSFSTVAATSTPTTISPLSKLDDEKNLHDMPVKQTNPDKKLEEETDDDDDDDEECTDDNDDECEYVDEDEEDDDDDDDFK